MDVVHAWCKGGSFSAIVELTDVYEGSIIRAMRRLEELLRDMCHAAKACGFNLFSKDIDTAEFYNSWQSDSSTLGWLGGFLTISTS